MNSANWCDLLLSNEVMRSMSHDRLETVQRAADDRVSQLAHGISGIGNLLACTASNSETGLSVEAVTDIGWMLETVGSLISNLADVSSNANYQLTEIKPAAKTKKAS